MVDPSIGKIVLALIQCCCSGDVGKHNGSYSAQRRVCNEATPDKEHESSEKGNVKTDIGLDIAVQRPRHGARKFHPPAVGRRAFGLSEDGRRFSEGAGSAERNGDDRE